MSLVQLSDPKRHASLSDGSSQMRAIRTIIENIADTDATVLIRGESGVGKDLVARAIPSVPPLRERREEIPALVSGFSRRSMRSPADSGSSHLRR